MDLKNFDMKKIPTILSMLGVLVMILWGVLGDAWDKSWIAACVGGVLSGCCYILFGKDKKKE